MVVTMVLRLLAAPLDSGELVGHVELVESGLVGPVRSVDELVAFARRASVLPEDTLTDAAEPDAMGGGEL